MEAAETDEREAQQTPKAAKSTVSAASGSDDDMMGSRLPPRFEACALALFSSCENKPLDLLHEPWWKQVLLFTAGMLGRHVALFIELLLQRDDASGANTCFANLLLQECGAGYSSGGSWCSRR